MTRARITVAVSAAVGLAVAAWLPSSAWAQTQAPAADQTAQNGQNNANGAPELQEVVVTAERRAENIQTTPIAVTAMSGDQLRAENFTNVGNLTEVAPSLSVVNQGGYQLIMMRGVGNTLGEDPVTTGVPVILDGLVNPRGTGLNWTWFDIGDVETLRGPQGTLVGANSTGGAILVNSANPNFRGVNGYVEAQAGNYHDSLEEAAVNLPVSDTFAMRIAAHHEQENSFYNDVGFTGTAYNFPNSSDSMLDPGNTDTDSARLSFLWKPSNNFQLSFKIQYDEQNTDGIPYNVNPNTYAPLAGSTCPYYTTPHGACGSQYLPNYSGNPWLLNYSTFTKYEYWDRFYIGDMRYTFGNGDTLHLLAGSEASQTPEVDANCYCSQNDGYALGGVGLATEPDTNDDVQLELISPNTGRFNWIAGAELVQSNGAFTSYTYTTGPAVNGASPTLPEVSYIPAGETTRELGVYGNINWQFLRTLQLTAGLRGNWDDNYGTGTFNIYPGGSYSGCTPLGTNLCGIPTSFPPAAYLDNQGIYKQNHQTGKIGLNWTPTQDQFFYAFFAHGYKPGLTQFHAFGTLQPNAGAETLNDYEIGWKGTFLQGHLTNQLGAYYDKYDDMQQNIFNPSEPNNGGIANVPTARIDGIEESLQAQLGHFGLNIASAWTQSVLGSTPDYPSYEFGPNAYSVFPFSYENQCAKGVPNTPGVGGCFNYAPYEINLKGAQDPYAPEWTANITAQYGFVFGEMTIQPRVQFSYTSKQYSNILQNSGYFLMNQRNLWNGYLDFIEGRWDTSLFGTNLTNETYMTNQTGVAVLYGAPRQYGVKTSFTF